MPINPFDKREGNRYVIRNRVDLLRALLDGKVKCKGCGYEFRSSVGSSMGYLEVAQWTSDRDPDILQVILHCGKCRHEGPYMMSPNPFMEASRLDEYGEMVRKYREAHR